MGIEPSYLSVARLFQSPYVFRVPKYQRNYAWDEEQIDDFLDDLQKCHESRTSGGRRNHFFGGIVSIAKTVPGSSRFDCEIVDGQQRLATFIILMSRVIKLCEELSREAASANDTDNENLAMHRIDRLKNTYLKFEDEINRRAVTLDKIELSAPDNQFFKDLIYSLSPSPSRDSHRRLEDAFTRIENKISEIVNNVSTISDKLDVLKSIEDIVVEDFTVIYISTDSKGEAYRLFQVLNNRGISLTEGDLLRARTLELLDNPSFSNQQATAENIWDKILSDPPELTEAFLRSYYASVRGKRPSKSRLFDEFLEAFFPEHNSQTILDQEADNIIQTIKNIEEEIEIYRKIVDGIWPFNRISPITLWDTDRLNLLIRELKFTNCIPLLLAACKLDQQKFSKIIQLTERFVFRYKIICNIHVTPLTNIFHRHAVLIRQDPSRYSINSFKNDLQTLQSRAPDNVFEPQLNQLAYSASRGNKQIKYLLTTLEHYFRWYEGGASGTPQCRDKSRVFDFTNTTIEHIYPQNASGTNLDQSMEGLKHTLGNLTFLGREDNEMADDSNFNTKKSILSSSSVQMNRKIAEKTTWSATEVQARQQILIEISKKVFKL